MVLVLEKILLHLDQQEPYIGFVLILFRLSDDLNNFDLRLLLLMKLNHFGMKLRELGRHKPGREAPVFLMMMMTKGCQNIAENFLEFLWAAVVIQLIVEAVEQLWQYVLIRSILKKKTLIQLAFQLH